MYKSLETPRKITFPCSDHSSAVSTRSPGDYSLKWKYYGNLTRKKPSLLSKCNWIIDSRGTLGVLTEGGACLQGFGETPEVLTFKERAMEVFHENCPQECTGEHCCALFASVLKFNCLGRILTYMNWKDFVLVWRVILATKDELIYTLAYGWGSWANSRCLRPHSRWQEIQLLASRWHSEERAISLSSFNCRFQPKRIIG